MRSGTEAKENRGNPAVIGFPFLPCGAVAPGWALLAQDIVVTGSVPANGGRDYMKNIRLELIFILLLGWRPKKGLEFHNCTCRGLGQVTVSWCLTLLLSPCSPPSLTSSKAVCTLQAFTHRCAGWLV